MRATKSPITLAASLVVLLTATSCNRLLGALEEEFEQKVRERIEQQAGQGEIPDDPDIPQVEPTIEINSIQPNRGLTTGNEPIEIVGFGFEPGMRVLFGPAEAEPSFIEITENSIHCLTPFQTDAGVFTVRVVAEDGDAALLENGFEYYDPVTIASATPVRGPTEGGTLVMVQGTGFIDGSTVQFGTGSNEPASVIDGNSLTVSTPPLERNTYAVTVTNDNGTFTLPNAFTTYEPVRVSDVDPFAGPLAGGTSITVTGTGFVNPTTLLLGGQILPATGDDLERNLATITLPANPSTEGPVSVAVENTNGDSTLNDGYVFYDPNDPTPRIIAITPNTGLLEGGREVHIVVGGMPDTSTDIAFDGTTLSDCTVHDPFTITCTSPPGGEGTVDVTVTNGATVLVEAGGFRYIDLRAEVAIPNEGAIAGGTYVRLFGSGFGPDTEVFFDGRPARDVTVVSPVEVTLRTPNGVEGLVDVKVATQGVDIEAEDLFTYFNPTDLSIWTSGGAVDGSVNVTVIDENSEPIPNAFVILGSGHDSARPHRSGFTNARGHITLSGPDIVGSQSVHAGRSGLGSFSWVDTNARNLTIMLNSKPPPPPDPLPECPQGVGGAPPLIRGNVYRIKDEFNTGNDYVVVTTTYSSLSSPLPDPGPKSQMINQGEYEMFARTNDLAVIALAGTVTPDNTLDVHAMGVRPFLFTEASTGDECSSDDDCGGPEQCVDFDGFGFCLMVYDDVDIIIDTPLSQPLRIELDGPPLGIDPFVFPAAPTTTIARVWYDFGYQGVFPMSNYPLGPYPFGVPPPSPLIVPGTDTVMFDMPKKLPDTVSSATFDVHAEVSGTNPTVGDSAWSESVLRSLSDTSQVISMSPLLQVNQETEPELFRPATADPTRIAFTPLPEDSISPPATGHVHYFYEVKEQAVCIGPLGPVSQPMVFIHWMAFTPGNSTDFDLPMFPEAMAEANFPSLAFIQWQLVGLFSPNVSFHNMDIGDLYRWKSLSGRVSLFVAP